MTAADASVIHDIGYRHYDGERLGRRSIWTALAVDTLRGSYGLGRAARSKVVPVLCLVGMCLPAVVISAVLAITGSDELPLDYTSYALNLQPLVAVFVAAQAPAAVSRDLRFGTVPLYFSRPLTRLDYVSAKLVAFTGAVLVLLVAPLTLLLAGALLAELPLSGQLPDYLRGLAQNALLAALLAAVGLAVAAATPRRGTGVAAVIALLTVVAAAQGFVMGTAVAQGRDDVARWAQGLSPFTLVDGVGSGLLGAETSLSAGSPGSGRALLFLAAAVALVALCWVLMVLRYRRVRAS